MGKALVPFSTCFFLPPLNKSSESETVTTTELLWLASYVYSTVQSSTVQYTKHPLVKYW